METTFQEHWDNLKWREINNTTKTFQLDEEPEVIHVIKTGFEDKYMIVHEDAYEIQLGRVEFGTKAEIEERFKIKL